MKAKTILPILLFLFTTNIHAQESILRDINNDRLNKYIELALQKYPRMQTFIAGETKAKSMATATKISFLDVVSPMYYKRFGNQGTATGQAY